MSDAYGMNSNLKVNKYYKKQFDQSTFRSRSGEITTEAEKTKLRQIDSRIDLINKSAKKKDTLGSRLKEYFRTAVGKSSWLSTQTVPEQKYINDDINEATKLFKIQSLSDSQKAKRGEKFKKKAEMQAKMINLIQKCRWERKEALKDLLDHGKNARVGLDISESPDNNYPEVMVETEYADNSSPDFLENIGEDIDDVSVMMRDISFYYEEQRNDAYETDMPEITSMHYKPLELIADPETRNEGYMTIINEFEKLDLTKFEYNNNEEFMENSGKNSFVKRYATLRAFSHVREMLDSTGRFNYRDRLYTKVLLVEDILRDYQSRAMLLQSPYHVLLAGKDFDSLSEPDLEARIERTEDILARTYLESVLDQKRKNVFKKGVKVEDLYKLKEDEIREQIVKRDDSIEHELTTNVKNKNMNEILNYNKCPGRYMTADGNLKSLNRNMESLMYRLNNGLELKNKHDEPYKDEVDFVASYSEDVNNEVDLKKRAVLAYEKAAAEKESIKRFYGKNKKQTLKNLNSTKEELFLSFINSDDTMAESMSVFSQYYNSEILKQKKEGTYRVDVTGSERRRHLDEFKDSDDIDPEMVSRDVDNLVNNLLADRVFESGDGLDLSMLDDDMRSWLRAYPVFSKFKELPIMDSSLEKKENKVKTRNYKARLKQIPADSEEAAELNRDLSSLKDELKEIDIKKNLRENMILIYKNVANALSEYRKARQRLDAITDAKKVIEMEPESNYRTKMLERINILEGMAIEDSEEYKNEFKAPINKNTGKGIALTKVQKDMMNTFIEIHDRIDELKAKVLDREKDQEEKSAQYKEALAEAKGLMERAHDMIRNYEDEEYEEKLQLRKTEEERTEEDRFAEIENEFEEITLDDINTVNNN